jgi:hypothetical protein
MWELERIRREGEREEGAGGERQEGAGGKRALLDPAADEVQMGLDGANATDGVDVGVGGGDASIVHAMRQAQILKVLCIY